MPETAVVDVPITSTPAPSVPSSPAAPAISAPSGTPAASERPTDVKSLSKFLQKEAATADATTPKPPLVADSAAAPIAQPPATTPTGVSDLQADQTLRASLGYPPEARWPDILDGQRKKAVAEFRQQLGPVADFNPQQREWLIDMAGRMRDPVAFHRWLGEQLQAHPTYGQQFRPAQPAATKPDPDVQIHDAAGNIVGMSYSADRQAALLKWEREQLTGEFKQLLQPFQQDRETRIAQERTDAQQKDLNTRADATMARVNKILGLESLPKDEAAALGKKLLDEMSRTPDAIEAALNLFERDVRPGLEKKGQDKALETNRQKAAANTANGSGPASPSARPTNAKELAKWMAANEGRS